MIKVDYIIVGSGLAGILFAEVLIRNNKTFVVIDNASQQSSIVAGGLYNPVVLKRFTEVWRAKEQLDIALPIYKNLEDLLKVKLDYKIPVKRLFNSVEEQNNWFIASDKPMLTEFLLTKITANNNPHIKANFGFGEVLQTGRIDTNVMIDAFKEYLINKEQFLNESFEYDALKEEANHIQYKNIEASNIVFAEGFGLKKNPFFNHLPLNGTKGELLTIHAPDLKIDFVLKSSVFLIPQGDDLYTVGATYEWIDKTNKTTQKGKEELLKKLKTFLKCEFKVVNQVAGIRPTVIDRRPLVGQHPKHKRMFVLNGLGTRGVMIAPYVAQKLFNFIEHRVELDDEINITRF
ncbi:MAG: FAD-binding oxidoreductase [Flavobacteriaceae bacterium]|nr:FAD-binding oxidoreductase [Flavobacteriaceae bacterium]